MGDRASTDATRRLTAEYDAQARAYVDYWAPFLQPMTEAFVADLPRGRPSLVLDIGTGAGRMLPLLRARYPSATVFGIDRSAGMLAQADKSERVAAGDAMALGVRSGAFDVTVMNFMLFHLPDPVAGLREAHRALRADGLLGLSTWASDMAAAPIDIFNEELEARGAITVDQAGRLAQHDLMDDTSKVKDLLDEAGFATVRAEVHQFANEIKLEDFLQLRVSIGATSTRFASLDEPSRGLLLANVRRRLEQLAPEDFTFRAEVIFAVGKRLP